MRRHNAHTARPRFLPLLLLIIPMISPSCRCCSCSSSCCCSISITALVIAPIPFQRSRPSLPRNCGRRLPTRWRKTVGHQRPVTASHFATKDENGNTIHDDDDDEHDNNSNNREESIIADDADSTLPIDLFSGDISEKKVPSLTSQITLGFFKFFSYCLQFVGLLFFCGLILNFAGYGYTFNFERGLVVDKIQNIRNEIQFEMEIEREEMEDLREGLNTGGSNALSITPEKNMV